MRDILNKLDEILNSEEIISEEVEIKPVTHVLKIICDKLKQPGQSIFIPIPPEKIKEINERLLYKLIHRYLQKYSYRHKNWFGNLKIYDNGFRVWRVEKEQGVPPRDEYLKKNPDRD